MSFATQTLLNKILKSLCVCKKFHKFKFISWKLIQICLLIKNPFPIAFFLHECQVIVNRRDEKVEKKLFSLQPCKSPPIILNLFLCHSCISGLNLHYLLVLWVQQELQAFLQLVSLLFWNLVIYELSDYRVLIYVKNDRVLKEELVEVHRVHENLKMSLPDYCFADPDDAREGTLDWVQEISCHKGDVDKAPFERVEEAGQTVDYWPELSHVLGDQYNLLFK